jgi:histidine triad (HIT) family protein
MNEDSIFTKIIAGEIPAHKVYEDDQTFVFMDIHPIQPGQVLIIPKQQIPLVWDLDDQLYLALMQTAKKVALKLREVFPEKTYTALLVEGLQVAHAHLKLFPFNTDAEFRNKPNPDDVPDHVELEKIAQKLAF